MPAHNADRASFCRFSALVPNELLWDRLKHEQ
jgi:hypothetical protein